MSKKQQLMPSKRLRRRNKTDRTERTPLQPELPISRPRRLPMTINVTAPHLMLTPTVRQQRMPSMLLIPRTRKSSN